MALVVIPRTEDSVYEDIATSPLDRPAKIIPFPHLGSGLVRPFRRDEKNDFSNQNGIELVKACVGQVLLTRASNPDNPILQGELDWAPERGSLLYLLRGKKNALVTQELGRIYVVDALRRWEPRVVLKSVRVSNAKTDEGGDYVLLTRLLYDVIATNVPANQVIYSNINQSLSLAA